MQPYPLLPFRIGPAQDSYSDHHNGQAVPQARGGGRLGVEPRGRSRQRCRNTAALPLGSSPAAWETALSPPNILAFHLSAQDGPCRCGLATSHPFRWFCTAIISSLVQSPRRRASIHLLSAAGGAYYIPLLPRIRSIAALPSASPAARWAGSYSSGAPDHGRYPLREEPPTAQRARGERSCLLHLPVAAPNVGAFEAGTEGPVRITPTCPLLRAGCTQGLRQAATSAPLPAVDSYPCLRPRTSSRHSPGASSTRSHRASCRYTCAPRS